MPDAPLSLDHIGAMVRDLDAGAERWRRLGFRLAPRSAQMGYDKATDTTTVWATANHVAMFRRGYLELIGIVDPDRPNPWARFYERYEGIHIVALRCADADVAYADIAKRTDALNPPVDRRRQAPFGEGTREMRFRNVFSRDERFPEGRFIVCEHQTPEVLWQEALMDHPNGAVALREVVFCTDDVAPTRDRLALITGTQASGELAQPREPGARRRRHVHDPDAGRLRGAFPRNSHTGPALPRCDHRGGCRHGTRARAPRACRPPHIRRRSRIAVGETRRRQRRGDQLHCVLMDPALALDHVGVALRDLDTAQASYERLGFRLTPRSMHSGAVTPGGPVVPWGSGNHCAMFHEGYLELFGITDPSLHSSAKALLDNYQGIHIVAFRVARAEAARASLAQRSGGIGPLRPFEREAAYGAEGHEARTARFRTFASDKGAFPEARFVFVEHLTPEILWQPHLLEHPNGALRLQEVTLCVTDTSESTARLTGLLGTSPEHASGALEFTVAAGTMRLVTPEILQRRWPGTLPPRLPFVAGFGIAVADIAATRQLLSESRCRRACVAFRPAVGSSRRNARTDPVFRPGRSALNEMTDRVAREVFT